jgi:LPXTG-motif cell wall-anchored protein
MSYGRRRRARFATLASGCIIIVFGLVVLLATSTVGAATTATLNPGQKGTVGTDVQPNCGQGPGWIFVLPDSQGDAFVSLSATFQTAGTVPGTVLANTKFASVNVALTDTLLNATAQINGGDEDSTFNLSHVCAVEEGSTTTTTAPETTTTVQETTTTAPETTTTVEETTTTAPETTTTIEQTTTTEPETTTTTESTTTTTSTSTSTSTTAPATTTSTSFKVEGTTILRSTTTTGGTVNTAGSTLPSPSTTPDGTVTAAATDTLPRTGNSQGVPVLGLAALALGAGLVLGSHRRFWRS